MTALSFINPFLLIGIIAAGIPLLIHLWSKRQAKIVDFSHVRFLMSLHRKKIRRLRLKQIFILILRMLIIALIAMALARPILTSKWAFAAGKAKTSAVIILDNSYSMGYEDLKGKNFDIAKDKATSLLDSLRTGDNASLILMSNYPNLIFKKLTSDIQQVRDSIKAAQISHRGTYVWSSISEAYKLLSESENPHKVIYLISDMGENGWQDWKDIPEKIEDVGIFVIKIEGKDSDNRTIENVTFSDELIGVGVSVQISAKVTGNSEGTAELFIDNEKKGQAIADPKAPTLFNHTFKEPGAYAGEIRLTPDKLSLDDIRYFALDVMGRIKVLTIGSNKDYVNLALNPISSLDPKEEYIIMPRGANIGELESVSLDQYDVIALVDLPEFSDSALRNLESFVLNGGNIIIFLGNSVNSDWYNRRFNLIPVKLGNRIDYSNKPIKFGKWNTEHPIFKIFNDPDTGKASDSLKSFEFYSAFVINSAETMSVIASFENNVPAVLEAEAGRGKIILFNTAPDPKVTDLPLKPGFLPIIQQTLYHLISSRAGGLMLTNILVGETYTQHIAGQIESPVIFDPDNNSFTPAIFPSEKDNKIQYGPVERSGIYRLEFLSEGSLKKHYFAVNLDTTSESQLKSIKDSEVKNKLGKQTLFLSLDESPEEAIGTAKSGSELSSRFLIAALILMLIEVPLANRKKMESLDDLAKE